MSITWCRQQAGVYLSHSCASEGYAGSVFYWANYGRINGQIMGGLMDELLGRLFGGLMGGLCFTGGSFHIQQADHDQNRTGPCGKGHHFAQCKNRDDATGGRLHGKNDSDSVGRHVLLADGLKQKGCGAAEEPKKDDDAQLEGRGAIVSEGAGEQGDQGTPGGDICPSRRTWLRRGSTCRVWNKTDKAVPNDTYGGLF